jgi:hypothetical protein
VIVGKTYLERGQPVLVLVQWGLGGGPRNVLIRRVDGTEVVRPFRGLRKPLSPNPHPAGGTKGGENTYGNTP